MARSKSLIQCHVSIIVCPEGVHYAHRARRTCPPPRASPGRESKAILIPVQVVLFLLITAVMVNWFAKMYLRNRRSWADIVARTSDECRRTCAGSSPAQIETLAAIWSKSPQVAFRDAGVLMEMADYEERNVHGADSARRQEIRAAALKLRMAAARAIIKRSTIGQSQS